MKVKDLIEQLEGCDPDSEVMLSYNYGDRSNTQVAVRVDRAEEETLYRSDYHRMWVVPEDPSEIDDEDTKDAVVLS